jgi:ankyrin repeat protein
MKFFFYFIVIIIINIIIIIIIIIIKNGFTAIVFGSSNGHFEIVKCLIEKKMDLNVLDHVFILCFLFSLILIFFFKLLNSSIYFTIYKLITFFLTFFY